MEVKVTNGGNCLTGVILVREYEGDLVGYDDRGKRQPSKSIPSMVVRGRFRLEFNGVLLEEFDMNKLIHGNAAAYMETIKLDMIGTAIKRMYLERNIEMTKVIASRDELRAGVNQAPETITPRSRL